MKYLLWRLTVLTSLTSLLSMENANAVGYRILSQNADAMARGNAFVATADNPSALYYNPAGITQLEGKQAQMGSYNLYFESQYKSLTGRESETTDRVFHIPYFYGTYNPEDIPLTFGVGAYSPFGLGVSWPTDSGFATLITKARIQYYTLSPVVAWEIFPGLSIAMGPTINYSAIQVKSQIGLVAGDEFSFDGTDWDFGYTAGILWQPHEQWSLGFKYTSETNMEYDGDLRLAPTTGVLNSYGNLDYPSFFSFGVSYRPTEKFNIEANIEFTDWDVIETTTITNPSGANVIIPANYSSGFMYKLGASYRFDNKITLSMGYFYTENNIENQFYNPMVPDTDLHTAAIGVGYEYKNWYYSLSYQHITGPWHEVRNSAPSATGQTADGDYQYTFHAISVSTTVKF